MPIQNHVVLLQALAVLAFVSSAYCYCQRPGFICMNNGNCTLDKTCQCEREWGGYDCRAPAKYTNCYKRCNNHGTCVMKRSCYCDFGWYGDNCQIKNETISCNMFSMDVEMRTPGRRVISLHGADDCSLEMDKSLLAGNEYVYQRTFPLSPDLRSPCATYERENLAPGVFAYTVAMSVQRKKKKFAPLDWITEFTCTYQRTANGSVERNLDYKRFEVDIVDNMKRPLENGAGTTQSKEFSLVFFSNITDHEVLVVELAMYDVVTSHKMYDLLVDGCMTHSSEKLQLLLSDQYVGDHLRYDGSRVSGTWVTINALNEAMEPYFDYKVRICKGQCTKPICGTKRIPETRPGIRIVLQ